MKKTKDDSNNVIETYTYGASRQRLKTVTSTQRTYYAWGGSKVLVEYTEAVSSSTPAYSKVYYYAGERLVSSNESGSSLDYYHHPDRLGTKVVSNSFSSSTTRQATFPFGTDFPAEGSGSPSAYNLLFTSYDRSTGKGLDYANNRTYSSGQSRFTQVDPIGMEATSIDDPQSNNLYAYTQNMPTDFVDPSGLEIVQIGNRTYNCIDNADRWDPETGTVYGGPCFDITNYFNPFGTVDSPNGGGGGGDPTQNANNAANACGVGAQLLEYSRVRGGKWYGKNSLGGLRGGNTMGWGGNGATGARSTILSQAKTYKMIGKVSLVAGSAISIGQGGAAISEGNYGKASKSTADLIMGGVGALGPVGFGLSATYFLTDVTIGHDTIAAWHMRNTNPDHCRIPLLIGPK